MVWQIQMDGQLQLGGWSCPGYYAGRTGRFSDTPPAFLGHLYCYNRCKFWQAFRCPWLNYN